MHTTVLLKESIDNLNLASGDTVIDGTLGAGGHSEEMCERFGVGVNIIALDLDSDAIERSKMRFNNKACNITYVLSNFKDFDAVLKQKGLVSVDGILLDLGFSSDQLELSGRGFSFKKDEPLKMTLKKEKDQNDFDAQDIVNNWDEEDIANVLYGYGEERFARRIAREIVEVRENSPIKTTTDLATIITNAVPLFYRHGRINPVTKTFQALRIAVNNELSNLQEVLPKGVASLSSGGRFAIITFHSLEDRMVKNFFRNMERDGLVKIITKKPITPSEEEIQNNPRARSAKLRVIEKI
ncbi:MAG: 16S rRNA (cytosine(1402)-N(4))-methyltransferase RsmH [Bacteroidetes bacterium]|nr:16S rRNA (cytosine(1402)-N(4))-methyltransferase RsmH [Bacteroidota bacterium]